MPSTEPAEKSVITDEPPPFGGTWGRLYALVLGELALLVLLFYLFTKAFE